MSNVEMIERTQERRKRRLAFLLLSTVLVIALGVLIGRSWFGTAAQEDADGSTVEVLSGVHERGLSVKAADTPEGPSGNVGQGSPHSSGVSASNSPDGGGSPSNSGPQGSSGGGSPGGGPPGAVPPGPPDGTPEQPRTFGISGELANVYPGFGGDLTVTLSNPHRFDIVVTTVEVLVGSPTGTSQGVEPCLASHLEVDDFDGFRDVARLDSDTQDLTVRMLASAPDACRGASFPLTYTGTATRANQQ
jgi:hypothetical protein